MLALTIDGFPKDQLHLLTNITHIVIQVINTLLDEKQKPFYDENDNFWVGKKSDIFYKTGN